MLVFYETSIMRVSRRFNGSLVPIECVLLAVCSAYYKDVKNLSLMAHYVVDWDKPMSSGRLL